MLEVIVNHSVEGLSLCSQSGGYHATIDGLDVWDLPHDHGPVLLFRGQRVDLVAEKEHICEVGKLGALGHLFPVLDLVVGDEEGRELLQGCHVVQPLDLVVRQPKLLQSCGHVFQILNPLDVVAGQ